MTRIQMKRLLCAVMLLATSAARAEGIDLNLSSDALRGTFDGSLTSIFPRIGGVYEVGALNGERAGFDYFQGHAGVLVTGDAGAERATVTAGLGVRLAFVDTDPQLSGSALALGGMIDARLPAFNRIGAIGYAYWAPNASSFGDITSYLEYAIDADYEVLRNASLYVGYRQLRLGADSYGHFSVDQGWHLGLRLSF
jgi:hypothetical protein